MTRRLVAGYLLLTLVILAVLMVPLGVANRDNLQRDLLLRMERDAVVVASLVEGDLRAGGAPRAQRIAAVVERYAAESGARVAVTDAEGDAVVDTEPAAPGPRNLASRPEIAQALGGTVATGLRRSQTLGGDLLFVAVPVAASGEVFGAVRVTYPGEEVVERARTYWLLLGGVALVTLLAVGAIGLVVARWVARPLATLEEGAAAVGQGELATRVPQGEGPPEVRALAARFNQMVVRLEELVGAQEAFVADASHQLRTPLTAMRLRIENLGHSAGPAGAADADAAIAEVDRLARLVDSLLALARADRRDAPAGELDLSAALRERTDSWADLAAEAGVSVEGDIAPGLVCVLADGVIEQVLDNLVDNAVRASPEGATVSVVARADGDTGGTILRVIDRGPGLSADERGHAFDRFWRAPSAPAATGSGLGLPIVARLVEAGGGSVALEETPGGGLTARVILPAA